MLFRPRTARCFSRLVAGLFAVQIVLTGFCLMPGQAHAMPMAHGAGGMVATPIMAGMDEHCAADMAAAASAQHKMTSHEGGCFHCVDAGKFMQAAHADMAPPALVAAGFVALPEPVQAQAVAIQPDVSLTTGPPGSFSLILTTTQRIRV